MNWNQLLGVASEMRAGYRSMIATAGPPDGVAEVRTLSVPTAEAGREVRVRAYLPASPDGDAVPVLVFVHGGGWVSGDLDTHDVLCRALAVRAEVVVLSVDYRLAPEHPYPAGLEDVYEVLAWAGEHAQSVGGDPARLAIAGDSAGGNIAAAAAHLTRDRGGPELAAQLLMYPGLRNTMDTPSWVQWGHTFPSRQVQAYVLAAYVPPGVSRLDPLVAPLWGDLRDLPPALILVGDRDPLRDECLEYADALRSAGGVAECRVYPGEHGLVQFFKDKRSHPHGEEALADGVGFLRSLLRPADD